MTRLKPSVRVNRRYLLIPHASKEKIQEALQAGLGTLGLARVAPLFVITKKSEQCVLSIDRQSLDEVRAAFELAPQKIAIIRVSGTIKGLGI